MTKSARSSGAERMRRQRRRQADGRIVLQIEVDEARLVDVLVASRRLSLAAADDRESIRAALEAVVGALRPDK